VREALRGLTVRGRAFLAAGTTAVVCAVLLGQPALTQVGVLVVVLPLLASVVLARSRYRLSLTRTVSPPVVAAGQPARVGMVISNQGRAPSGTLLLEDQVPYVLGSRPRFVLDGVGHGWRREVSYQVRSDVRGRFEVGPMTVRVGDAFGLVELGRAFQATASLTVTPHTTELPSIALGGGWSGSGDQRPRAFAVGSAEDVTVRDYRRGDDLRRVHWASSARTGELMVRREEQPWQARATVLLDNRRHAHRGRGVASSLEAAVSTAASVVVHLSRRGYQVRLVTAQGPQGDTRWHEHQPAGQAGPLLEALAVVETVARTDLEAGWLREQAQGGLTVAVLGEVAEHDRGVLRRMRHHTGAGLALALDVDAWGGSRRTDGAAPGVALLESTGWRTTALHPTDRLEDAWRTLGRRGVGTGLTTAPPPVAR